MIRFNNEDVPEEEKKNNNTHTHRHSEELHQYLVSPAAEKSNTRETAGFVCPYTAFSAGDPFCAGMLASLPLHAFDPRTTVNV